MQNQMMGGLLAPQAPQQQTGGLLGPAGNPGLQMAQQLAQNPTPQMAQQIMGQLRQRGGPEAQQMEQILGQVMNDPQQLKQFADSIIQHLSGGPQ